MEIMNWFCTRWSCSVTTDGDGDGEQREQKRWRKRSVETGLKCSQYFWETTVKLE